MSSTHTESRPEESVVERTKEKGKEAAEQGLEKAKEAGGQTRDYFSRQLDERSTQAGQQVSSLSESLSRFGSQLRDEGQAGQAKMAEGAAERIGRLSSYLEEGNGDRFLRDLEDVTRRRPWAVAAGAFAVGLVASRFLKASAERRSTEGQSGDAFKPRLATAGTPTPQESSQLAERHSSEPLMPSLKQP